MGQHHYIVNLDKKQWIYARGLDCGLKLSEQAFRTDGPASALILLLAASNGRGGGDVAPNPLIGSWAGDRIAVIGDYAKDNDVPGANAKTILSEIVNDGDEWEDLSMELRILLGTVLDDGPRQSSSVLYPHFSDRQKLQ